MAALVGAIPGWLWAILVIALIIFLGNALHIFTIHFSLSIP